MFSLDVIDTDEFLEMPATTQNLYFHLGLRGDDDGFVSSPKKIMKIINASEDDLKVLFAKKFIIGFDTGIIVIRHWKIHNYIQSDRYSETIYQEEKELLTEENRMYTKCIQNGNTDKVSIELGKISKEKVIDEKNKIPPTLEMVKEFCKKRNNNVNPVKFHSFYSSKGWYVGKNKMKDWQQAIYTWENDNKDKQQPNPSDNYKNTMVLK
jgi:hypothetical protein